VEPFATWLETLRWVSARAYAVVAAWCARVLLYLTPVRIDPSAEA
jgi:hypothetical protein